MVTDQRIAFWSVYAILTLRDVLTYMVTLYKRSHNASYTLRAEGTVADFTRPLAASIF